MTAQEYLSELQHIEMSVQMLVEERDYYLSKAATVSSPSIVPDKVQVSHGKDKLANLAVAAADKDAEITEMVIHLFDRREEIIKQIRGLHELEYIQILYRVYVEGKSLKTVADELNRSYRHVMSKRKEALAAFEEMYSDLLQEEPDKAA